MRDGTYILLRFSPSDLEDDDEAQDIEDSLNDWGGTVSVFVEREAPDSSRVRVAEPVSISPFGPVGPGFNDGDIIEVSPLDNGTYRFVRVVTKADPWTLFIGGVTRQEIRGPQAEALLATVIDQGGGWEYGAGNLRVQFPNDEGRPDAPQRVSSLFAEIRALLGKKQ